MHSLGDPEGLTFNGLVVLSIEDAFNELILLVTANFGIEENRDDRVVIVVISLVI